MVNMDTVQAGVHSLGISMMKTKTMVLAGCISVCALGAEAIFVPMAMNSSYENFQQKEAIGIIPVTDVTAKPSAQSGGRYIPLAPVKQRGPVNRDSDSKTPVS